MVEMGRVGDSWDRFHGPLNALSWEKKIFTAHKTKPLSKYQHCPLGRDLIAAQHVKGGHQTGDKCLFTPFLQQPVSRSEGLIL